VCLPVICPYCGHPDTKVLETRAHPSGSTTRRRRNCTECDGFFYTIERLDTAPLVVAKRDGTREDFDRKRLVDSLAVAGTHSLDEQKREAVADTVIAHLRGRGPLVTSYEVGETALTRLREVDILTYVRYALFFIRPRDAADFADWLARHAPDEGQESTNEGIIVHRRDGTREVFDRKILHNELTQACRGRPAITAELIEQEVQALEQDARKRIAETGAKEISTQDLNEMVFARLSHLDTLSYLSYAIVHKSLDSYSKIRAELTTFPRKLYSSGSLPDLIGNCDLKLEFNKPHAAARQGRRASLSP
jgi:transcriptional repressor NrdR